MTYSSCPTAVVNAPVRIVWRLLTKPAGWGEFFDVRITGTSPDGLAVVGQKIYAESGPSFLHLKVEFQFVEIDPERYRLGLDVRLPFGLSVRENLDCAALDPDHCRVNYHCDFSLPTGWRGAIARPVMRRELDAGPIDSLSRLKRAADQFHALAPA
jgi:Polyketide cyclase / dehydrase and lipid transport